MEEPCSKKLRMDTSQNVFKIKSILSDDLYNPIPLQTVVVSKIENKKYISSIVHQLSQRIPLESLQHLKRVRQNEIILCLASDLDDSNTPEKLKDSVKEFIIAKGISSEMAISLCKNVSQVKVASIPTKLRWQYDEMNKLWPCKFHPNRYLESMYDGSIFSNDQKKFHSKIASILLRLSEKERKPFAICIDPRTNSVVAIATGNVELNPVKHSPMVLIDFVARSQNGGAWQYDEEIFLKSDDTKINQNGIPERWYRTITEDLNEELNYGAENISLQESRLKATEEMQNANNLEKYGPYICTGYDVYLLVEPCLMCAMGLLHSRARRIFYLNSSENGALETLFKLHSVRELNHHYEVFKFANEMTKFFNKCC